MTLFIKDVVDSSSLNTLRIDVDFFWIFFFFGGGGGIYGK